MLRLNSLPRREGCWGIDLKTDIHDLFLGNIRLLAFIDRAICYFRLGRYDKALEMIVETGDGINNTCEAIISERDYFAELMPEAVSDMLKTMLAAKQSRDYALLTDLYEMQLAPFICKVQEIIIRQEDFLVFDEETYRHNIELLTSKVDASVTKADESLGVTRSMSTGKLAEFEDRREREKVNRNAALLEPLIPKELLDKGYSVEFTACGLMTAKAPLPGGSSIYLHTNNRMTMESFTLAYSWISPEIETYIVCGLGMGYHIEELISLAPDSRVCVYETDINILKLYAAFTEASLLTDRRVSIIYDPDGAMLEHRLGSIGRDDKVCIHFPSYRRMTGGERLSSLVPWGRLVERC